MARRGSIHPSMIDLILPDSFTGLQLSYQSATAISASPGLTIADYTNQHIQTTRTLRADIRKEGPGAREEGTRFDSGDTVHIYVIQSQRGRRGDALLLSQSATNPNIPSGYDIFRRIASTVLNEDGYFTRFRSHHETFYTHPLELVQQEGGFAYEQMQSLDLVIPTGITVQGLITVYTKLNIEDLDDEIHFTVFERPDHGAIRSTPLLFGSYGSIEHRVQSYQISLTTYPTSTSRLHFRLDSDQRMGLEMLRVHRIGWIDARERMLP